MHFFKSVYTEIAKSNYFRNLVILTSGVGLSQLIPLILFPVLTRFFTPSEFGVLALFMAVVQLLAICMTFRLEMAIVLPKKDTDAAILCLVSIISLFIFSLLTFIISIFSFPYIISLDFMNDIEGEAVVFLPTLIYLIPIGFLLLGVYNVLYHWNNRLELYKNMTYSHVTHSIFSTPLSLVFYFSSFKPVGLILGQILGRFIACFLLLQKLCLVIQSIDRSFLFRRVPVLIKKYNKFIIYETPHAILNFISQKYILTVLSGVGTIAVGVFDVADKILGKPLSIISNSIKTIFYKRLTTAKGKIAIFNKSLLLMIIVGFALTFPIAIIPNEVFVFVLGDNWGEVGQYIQLISPLLFSRFIFNVVVPSISYTLRNYYLLIWQIIYFICLVVLFSFLRDETVDNVLFVYAIFGAFMYFVLGLISFLVLKNHVKN